jgi:SAM-dependent methyltransferase
VNDGRTDDGPAARRAAAWDRYWAEVPRAAEARPGGFTRWAVSFLQRAGVRRVLDLGCGAGRDLRYLLDLGFDATGVDASPRAVALAERAVASLADGARRRGRVVRADLLDFLGSADGGAYDAVHAAATYQSLSASEDERARAEVARVLASGGLHL